MSSEVTYNRIAMLRAERGVTRRQLAEAIGVHYQTVGYLERGEFSPSLHLALRLSRYFEVPVEVIFSLDPFPRLGASANGSASAANGSTSAAQGSTSAAQGPTSAAQGSTGAA